MIKQPSEIHIVNISEPLIGVLHHAHCSSIISFEDGSLLSVYFHAIKEAHRTQAIYGRRKTLRNKSNKNKNLEKEKANNNSPYSEWDVKFLLSKDIKFFRMEGNPVLWKDPMKKKLFLFYVTSWGGWSTCILRYKVSNDNGKTWSKSKKIYKHISRVSKNPPIMLSNGAYLLPATIEFRECTPLFFISNDKGKTWKDTGARLTVPEEYIPLSVKKQKKNKKLRARMLDQPTIIERSDGTIYCLMRAYRPLGKMFESESKDGGFTWSAPRPSRLPNPDGGFNMIKLKDGSVAIIYNHSSQERNPLSIALSEDEGRTWHYRRNILEYHGEIENDKNQFMKSLIQKYNEEKGIESSKTISKKELKERSLYVEKHFKEWIESKKEGEIIGPENFQYPTLYQSSDGNLHCTWSHGYSKIVNGKLVQLTDIQYCEINPDWIREETFKDDVFLL